MNPKLQPRIRHESRIVKGPSIKRSQDDSQKLRPFISAHALSRYRERVDSTVSQRAAIRSMLQIWETAKPRSKTPKWMRDAGIKRRGDSRHVYSADHPDVCLIVRDGVVVTVLSRQSCAESRRNAARHHWPTGRPFVPYKRPPPGGWLESWEGEAA